MSKIFMEYGQGNLPRLPRHQNPGLEIIYLQEGHLLWECEGKKESYPPETLYFTLPGQIHGSALEFEPAHYWYFVVIRADFKGSLLQFPKELGFDVATEKTISDLLTQATEHVVPASNIAKALLPGLVEELEKPGILYRPRVLRITGQLILDLAISCSRRPPLASASEAARFAKLLAELAATSSEPWTLEEMASRLRLGMTRFTALFRQQTGESPMHHLQRLRIDRARKLLRTSDASITDIAMACGFSSSQHFAHVFRQYTNSTALEYRRHGPPELILPRIMEPLL